jgi:hypothetical protein
LGSAARARQGVGREAVLQRAIARARLLVGVLSLDDDAGAIHPTAGARSQVAARIAIALENAMAFDEIAAPRSSSRTKTCT